MDITFVFECTFQGLVEDEREAAAVAAPQKMMPKMPPGINVRRRTGPTAPQAAVPAPPAVAAAVAVGPAPAKRPKQQAEPPPAIPRKQPQSAAAQGRYSIGILDSVMSNWTHFDILSHLSCLHHHEAI